MAAATLSGDARHGGSGADASTVKLPPFFAKTGSIGVLLWPAREGNCCALGNLTQEISSYFPWLIANAQNKLLSNGCWQRSLQR
jgi:hypothetical protein